MNNTKRKAKVQGVLRRAKQTYKRVLRHRHARDIVTKDWPDACGRYACINLQGETVATFTDEHGAYAWCNTETKAMNFCTVLDRGPGFNFVPSLTKIR